MNTEIGTSGWLVGVGPEGILVSFWDFKNETSVTLCFPPEEAELMAQQLMAIVARSNTQTAAELPVVDAFEEGWNLAARWANRDDMLHDTGSAAYRQDRDAALLARKQKGGSV